MLNEDGVEWDGQRVQYGLCTVCSIRCRVAQTARKKTTKAWAAPRTCVSVLGQNLLRYTIEVSPFVPSIHCPIDWEQHKDGSRIRAAIKPRVIVPASERALIFYFFLFFTSLINSPSSSSSRALSINTYLLRIHRVRCECNSEAAQRGVDSANTRTAPIHISTAP